MSTSAANGFVGLTGWLRCVSGRKINPPSVKRPASLVYDVDAIRLLVLFYLMRRTSISTTRTR